MKSMVERFRFVEHSHAKSFALGAVIELLVRWDIESFTSSGRMEKEPQIHNNLTSSPFLHPLRNTCPYSSTPSHSSRHPTFRATPGLPAVMMGHSRWQCVRATFFTIPMLMRVRAATKGTAKMRLGYRDAQIHQKLIDAVLTTRRVDCYCAARLLVTDPFIL
jgi:hypothetical protein